MDKAMKIALKYKRFSTYLFILFVILTLIVIPLLSYIFDNYWLLFGIVFSYLGKVLKVGKLGKLFYLITVGIIIYWFTKGFSVSDEITFFWLSFLIGYICQTLIIGCDSAVNTVMEMDASEKTDEFMHRMEITKKIRSK